MGKLDISLVSAELEGETHDRLHSKIGEPGGNRDLQKLSGIPSRASPEMCGLGRRRSQLTWYKLITSRSMTGEPVGEVGAFSMSM